MRRLIGLALSLLALWGSNWPVQADQPAPHLGYGIHIAPNVRVDTSMVNALGMDWVKIY